MKRGRYRTEASEEKEMLGRTSCRLDTERDDLKIELWHSTEVPMCAGNERKKNAGCAKCTALRARTPDRRKRKFCSFFIHRNAPGFRNFTLIIAGWKLRFSESFK